MIKMYIDSRQFRKEMNNIVEYSLGFLDGINNGKSLFLRNLGMSIKEVLEFFVDSNAKMDPQALHHVYEWYKTGSPEARLYDITFTVSNVGLTFYTKFKQSTSIKDGSRVPFYDKARVMEEGISVRIEPRSSDVLVFEKDGETVFTKSPVVVNNPGGDRASGAFEKVINMFFKNYFTQAFLRSSGIMNYLSNPVVYKKNLPAGKKMGRNKGMSTGYAWIANAGVIR